MEYKGYTIEQASNNHVIITKEEERVMHVSCNHPLTDEELIELAEAFLKLSGREV